MILGWLAPGQGVPELKWTPAVRASFGRQEPLPADARLQAIRRGVTWYERARLLVHESWKDKVRAQPEVAPAPPASWPAGDGRCGMLEGHSSSIFADGSQPVRWSLRADCNSESAMALALHGLVDRGRRSGEIAARLLDFVYAGSGLQQGPRANPQSPSYGLLGWDTRSREVGVYFGDDNARAMLATMAVAGALNTDRWDEPLLRCLLGNFRTCGQMGFRGVVVGRGRPSEAGLAGLLSPATLSTTRPHYESWLWACYLWLYDKTHFEPLRDRARKGIGLMMQGYPQRWSWVNGQQQIERSRMLLPLAWLVRVDDTPQHRAVAEAHGRRACWPTRTPAGRCRRRLAWALASNEQYGTCEISLLQANGDPVSDMIYTCNFALLGLNEAAAATGDEKLRRAADRLAEFLVRIQIRSEAHPELDGGWFRGFDFRRWDYWGSNGDSGWGAWCTETGWTQAWIVTGLAMRQMNTSLWDMTKKSNIARQFEKYRRSMIPDEALVPPVSANQVRHAALGKPVTLAVEADSRYPACGPESLTDGLMGKAACGSPEWLGFEGKNLEAVIDLGVATPIRRVGANFLQVVPMGVFLPPEVEFSVSSDGKTFRAFGHAAQRNSGRSQGRPDEDFRHGAQGRHRALRQSAGRKPRHGPRLARGPGTKSMAVRRRNPRELVKRWRRKWLACRTFRRRAGHLLAPVRRAEGPPVRLPGRDCVAPAIDGRHGNRRRTRGQPAERGRRSVSLSTRGSRRDLPLRLDLRLVLDGAARGAEAWACRSWCSNLQPVPQLDYAKFNRLGDRGVMTGVWLEHCQACCAPEIACVFNRAGIAYHLVTGYLEDEAAWGEIGDWVEAAKVAAVDARQPRGRARPLLLRHAGRLQRPDPAVGRLRQPLRAARRCASCASSATR